ncbi:MAG: aldehyde ferredoxin oxidoreductase family protein [Desulfobacterota bacterium]|nr:aldehyde ferredoxin oxidoreductase family protein [Thermodesulfobacteriota bacterium]
MHKPSCTYVGYAGKYLRVDLGSGTITEHELTNSLAEQFIGGVGIAARILYDAILPGIDPLGDDNKLMFFTGPLEGTMIPTASRIGLYGKSPLTNSFFYSSAGGYFGPELKFAGYDGILIEGVASHPVYLFIDNNIVELRDASHLWGMDTNQVQHAIADELGSEEVRIAAIGPAGERLVRFACVISGCRALGRGGLGAVMGSKKLKAVAVRGSGGVSIPDMRRMRALLDDLFARFSAHPATSEILPRYGTPVLVHANNELGLFGYRNWQDEYFPQAEGLSGETMRKKIVKRDKSCFACPARCSKFSIVGKGMTEGCTVEGPEYEDIFSLGSMCGHNDIEVVAAAERLCDDIGIDAIEAGVAIAFAMECYERGLLSLSETDGLEVRFGRADLIVPLIKKIGLREGRLGNLLAEGVKRAADRIGKGADRFAMQNKGLTFPGHSARGLPGFALGYATGPRGASHHDGRPTGERTGLVKRATIEGKAEYTARINHLMVLLDALILCHLPEGIWGPLDVSELLVRCINTTTGMNMTLQQATTAAERIWNVMRAFAVREGYRREHDRLPPRFMEEPIPSGPSKGMVITRQMLDAMLDDYYTFRGWDVKTGIPTRQKLLELGLEDIAEDMGKY